jgi:hypothetical protein
MTLNEIFNVPQAKILDFVFSRKDDSFTSRQIHEATDIPLRTLQRWLPRLVEEGCTLALKSGRTNGKCYRFNGAQLRWHMLAKAAEL